MAPRFTGSDGAASRASRVGRRPSCGCAPHCLGIVAATARRLIEAEPKPGKGRAMIDSPVPKPLPARVAVLEILLGEAVSSMPRRRGRIRVRAARYALGRNLDDHRRTWSYRLAPPPRPSSEPRRRPAAPLARALENVSCPSIECRASGEQGMSKNNVWGESGGRHLRIRFRLNPTGHEKPRRLVEAGLKAETEG